MRALVAVTVRRLRWLVAVPLVAVLAASLAACGSDAADDVAAAPMIHQGAPHPGDDFPLLPGHCQSPTEPMPFRPCHVTHFGPKAPTVAVYGDSHAWMYLPALKRAADQKHANLVMILAGGCPPADPLPRVAGQPYTECESHDTRAMSYIRTVSSRPTPFALVLGAYWSGYTQGQVGGGFLDGGSDDSAYAQRLDALARDRTTPLFDALARMQVQVDVIGQAGTVPADVAPCDAGRDPYRCDVPRTAAMPDEADIRDDLRTLMRPLSGHPLYLDPSRAYCDATTCHGVVDGRPTWYDDIHLSKDATQRMTRYFTPVFSHLS